MTAAPIYKMPAFLLLFLVTILATTALDSVVEAFVVQQLQPTRTTTTARDGTPAATAAALSGVLQAAHHHRHHHHHHHHEKTHNSPPSPSIILSSPPPPPSFLQSRRLLLQDLVTKTAATAAVCSVMVFGPTSGPAVASDDVVDEVGTRLYQRQLEVTVGGKKEISYTIMLPSSMKESSKPVKTHLDEVNFAQEGSLKYGVTVDPVKIKSLREFGTPEEVAARVVTAEVNRDGVFEVTLLTDPGQEQDPTTGILSYNLEYLSVGKRGNKHYINKIVISPDQLLYVLTAQCKEEDFQQSEKSRVAQQMKDTVKSFQVTALPSSSSSSSSSSSLQASKTTEDLKSTRI